MEIDLNGSPPPPPSLPSWAINPSRSSSLLAKSLNLEHQLVHVPFDQYKKKIRFNQRIVGKEVSALISGIQEMAAVGVSGDEAIERLTSLVSRLQGLKRKMEEGSLTEQLQAQRCRARLDHLESAHPDNLSEWSNVRLSRILVDYMLRMSYHVSAVILAEARNIQDLVDIEVFLEAWKVYNALQKKEVGSVLSWCAENKWQLKKFKSTLEFQLRLQEFVELVRAENYMQAIDYARKYLEPWAATHMKELQQALATLVFKGNTECATYKALFEPKQWDLLLDQFGREFCRVNGITREPLLFIYLQAGLSALKTPICNKESCPKEDPLSHESFRKLAEPLPCVDPLHSKLFCYITKELMDTENPPLVLPNGYAYGTKALKEMAKKNDGKITCPRSGYVCDYSDLVKAFIS